eukprot:4100946-Pyramimonas_sp.AAC.1
MLFPRGGNVGHALREWLTEQEEQPRVERVPLQRCAPEGVLVRRGYGVCSGGWQVHLASPVRGLPAAPSMLGLPLRLPFHRNLV